MSSVLGMRNKSILLLHLLFFNVCIFYEFNSVYAQVYMVSCSHFRLAQWNRCPNHGKFCQYFYVYQEIVLILIKIYVIIMSFLFERVYNGILLNAWAISVHVLFQHVYMTHCFCFEKESWGPKASTGIHLPSDKGFVHDMTVTTETHVHATCILKALDETVQWTRMWFKQVKSRFGGRTMSQISSNCLNRMNKSHP